MDQAAYTALIEHRTNLAVAAINELMTTLVDTIVDGHPEQAKQIQDRIDVLFNLSTSANLKVELEFKS